jgi:sulfur-oxidizing protein SoxY
MRRAVLLLALAAALGTFGIASTAQAGKAWDEIRASVFANRPIAPAGDLVTLTAPFRPTDQRAVPIDVEAKFADGRSVRTITLIVDENPSPIAARFDFGAARERVHLATRLRLNAGTDVRAVVEASDGQLYMAERFVRFAGGQAACSAPPSGTPQEIAATMGKMSLEPVGKQQAAATAIEPRARLKIMHPNHTGMVLDQLTLLYIPLRIITDLEVRQGEERIFAMRGSMTMAQDPVIEFDYRAGADTLHVTARDSDGASWARDLPVGQGS